MRSIVFGCFLISLAFSIAITAVDRSFDSITTVQKELDGHRLTSSAAHAPIFLSGDAALDAFPNKTGLGNPSSPYIIQGLSIDAAGGIAGIYINHTTKNLIIMECEVFNANTEYLGASTETPACIKLGNCTNVNVSSCLIHDGGYHGIHLFWTTDHCIVHNNTILGTDAIENGVFIESSFYNLVAGNHVSACNEGIYPESSDYITVTNNNVTGCVYDAIYFHWSDHGIMKDNILDANYRGFYGDACTNVSFLYNNISDASYAGMYLRSGTFNASFNDVQNCYYGIEFYQTSNSYAMNNTITGSMLSGIYLHWSDHDYIWNNTMVECGLWIEGANDDYADHATHDIQDNTVDGRGIAYLVNDGGVQPIDLAQVSQVFLMNCSNRRLSNAIIPSEGRIYVFMGKNNSVNNITILNGHGKYGFTFRYTSNATIQHSSVIGSTGGGIWVTHSTDTHVDQNVVEGCTQNGIEIQSCVYNFFTDNILNNNTGGGIRSIYSSGNFIMGANTITNCNRAGISLYGSTNETVANNYLWGCGITIDGFSDSNFNGHEINASNLVNGKQVLYLVGQSGLDMSTVYDDAGQVILVACSSCIVRGFMLANTSRGIALYKSHNNQLSSLDLTSSGEHGIKMYYSDGNHVSDVDCSRGDRTGIYIEESNNGAFTNVNATDCGNHGIELYYGNNMTFSYCHADSNTKSGVYMDGNSNAMLVWTTCNANGKFGVDMYYSSATVMCRCTIRANLEAGVVMRGTSSSNISWSVISQNSGHGVIINQSSSLNTLWANWLESNSLGNALDTTSAGNAWDNGSAGNRWGDYTTRYPSATNDGTTWNTPYDIPGTAPGQDNHPLVDKVPSANVTSNVTTAEPGTGVQFTVASLIGDGPFSCEWQFDDGGQSTMENPVHVY
nr:right-handed parallel beta-helix repeat-containing protein [Candidatus Sigynarchaeota archaeon]